MVTFTELSQATILLVMCTPVSLSTHHTRTSISNHSDSDIRSCLRCSPEAIQVTHQTVNTVSKHIVVLASRSETGVRMGCEGNGIGLEWQWNENYSLSIPQSGNEVHMSLTHLT